MSKVLVKFLEDEQRALKWLAGVPALLVLLGALAVLAALAAST